jgi:hypothetical protein
VPIDRAEVLIACAHRVMIAGVTVMFAANHASWLLERRTTLAKLNLKPDELSLLGIPSGS